MGLQLFAVSKVAPNATAIACRSHKADARCQEAVARACEGFHRRVDARDAVGCNAWNSIKVA